MRHFFPFPGPGGWYFWPHFLGAGLLALVWVGLLGLLIWALLRLFSGRSRMSVPAGTPWQSYGTPPAEGSSAIEILRQRYARGEVDAETYQQMLERLQASYPADSIGGGAGM
jgi:putative membrane protein